MAVFRAPPETERILPNQGIDPVANESEETKQNLASDYKWDLEVSFYRRYICQHGGAFHPASGEYSLSLKAL